MLRKGVYALVASGTTAAVVALVLALGLFPSPSARRDPIALPEGPTEGIQVDGHWTIEVLTPMAPWRSAGSLRTR
jgi:hypothetical protein